VIGAASNHVIARGLGRSYGDPAQTGGGTVIDNRGLVQRSMIDPETGTITLGSGVSLDELLREAIPAGYFVPVTPGTRQVTIGGAIAADIHGKNHHVDGSFMDHIEALTLVTPTGTFTISPSHDPELFWATAGGMGLTGVVVEATLRLMPIETSSVLVDTERFDDLDALMDAMVTGDHRYRYSVAWVDCMTKGARLGRGVLTRGDHAAADQVPLDKPRLTPPGAPKLAIPFTAPKGLLNKFSIAAFNEAWFRKAPKHRDAEIQSLSTFFHPLDGVSMWNRLHGPRGFLQYQFVVPDSASAVVRQSMELLSSRSVPSFLAVLKRFGEGNSGLLSFPSAGWTLALDIPLGAGHASAVLDELDDLIAHAGGRIYLAKDSRLSPHLIPTMYPKLEQFQAVCDRVDPAKKLGSDLSRRLNLRG
jgi:decaprenylphospho-beta-D-ribofuranose 2-oxidase